MPFDRNSAIGANTTFTLLTPRHMAGELSRLLGGEFLVSVQPPKSPWEEFTASYKGVWYEMVFPRSSLLYGLDDFSREHLEAIAEKMRAADPEIDLKALELPS